MKISNLFKEKIDLDDNLIKISTTSQDKNQAQTNAVFSEKWNYIKSNENTELLATFQKEWFLELYGFQNEEDLAKTLQKNKIILDAGCGLGYKSVWFAELAPQSIVVGMDYSSSVEIAAEKYNNFNNLYFVQGDIAATNIKEHQLDFIVCDQVIMHTENPNETFAHLSKLLAIEGEFCCYVYRKKALPRELLDTYFRDEVHNISKDQIWEMSEQLTLLGERLSKLEVKIDSPDIPLLGITGGKMDIQRFIYWNFIKCFWKEDWSHELNISTNFDWYSPSNAKRFSEEEFKILISKNKLSTEYFHKENACYSGRFKK